MTGGSGICPPAGGDRRGGNHAWPSPPPPCLICICKSAGRRAALSRGVVVGPGLGAWNDCARFQGCLGRRNKCRCVLPPAEGGREWVLGVVCCVLTDVHIPQTRGCLPRVGVWGNRPPGHAGRSGRAALCLQGFSAWASRGSSWDLGSPVPSVRPAPSIPPQPSACPSPPLAAPRTPGPFLTGGWGAFCSYFSTRAGAEPRVKNFPPTPLPERIPRGPFALGTHRGPRSLVRADLDLPGPHRFTNMPRSAALREKS